MLTSLENGTGIDPLSFKDEAGIMKPVAQCMGLCVAPGQHFSVQPDAAVTIIKRDQRHFFTSGGTALLRRMLFD